MQSPEQRPSSHSEPEQSPSSHSEPEQPSSPHSETEQYPSSHSNPEQPPSSHSEPEQPPSSQSKPEQPPSSHSDPEQPPESHYESEQPPESHYEPEQPPESHSEQEQPPESHSEQKQPPSSHSEPEQPPSSHSEPEQPPSSHSEPEQPPEYHSDPEQPPEYHYESGRKSKKRYLTFGMINYIFCLIIPFVLLPLALSKYKEAKCAYVILWMILYWILQPVNIAVTSLLPVPMFPLLGILDTGQVTTNYMKDVLMMFIGGLGMAVAVEHCNLHKRVALKVLSTLGAEIKWLLLGFMSTTMFLSMWISNTAATAMMVPIIEAVMGEIALKKDESVDEKIESTSDSGEKFEKLHKTLLLGIAYSSTLGGTGTMVGSPPNLALVGFMDTVFPDSHDITYASWMAYHVPGMIIGVFAAWIILQVMYFPCWHKEDPEEKKRIETVINAKYQEMGTMTFHEAAVLGFFVLLVFLWIFRQPRFIPGWADLLSSGKKMGDAVPAILILILMFVLPAKPWMIYKSPRLLTWKVVQAKMPWGLVLLLGGGFAMADGAKESGLSHWLNIKLRVMSSLSPSAVLCIVFIIATILTEAVNNTTVAAIFLPLVIDMALSFRINPLYLMVPITMASSYAFMLPVGTPTNAIVFDTGHLKAIDMAKPGIIMNVIGLLLQLFLIHTLGNHMFHLSTFPSWANATHVFLSALEDNEAVS